MVVKGSFVVLMETASKVSCTVSKAGKAWRWLMCAYGCSSCACVSVLKSSSEHPARGGMLQSSKYKSFGWFYVKKVSLVRGKKKDVWKIKTTVLLKHTLFFQDTYALHLCWWGKILCKQILRLWDRGPFCSCDFPTANSIVINSLEKPFLKSLLPLFSYLWLLQSKVTHIWFVWLEFRSVSDFFYAIYMNSTPVSFIQLKRPEEGWRGIF